MKKIKKYTIFVQLQKLFYKRWENQAYTKAYRKKKSKKHVNYDLFLYNNNRFIKFSTSQRNIR